MVDLNVRLNFNLGDNSTSRANFPQKLLEGEVVEQLNQGAKRWT